MKESNKRNERKTPEKPPTETRGLGSIPVSRTIDDTEAPERSGAFFLESLNMNSLLPACFAVVLSVSCFAGGVVPHVFGGAGGSVKLAGVDATLRPHIFNLNWGGDGPKGSMFPKKDGLFLWTIEPNGKTSPAVAGTLKVQPGDVNAARLTWTFTPQDDLELNEIAVTVGFRYAEMREGKVLLDARVVELPDEKPQNAQLAYGSVRDVKVVDAAGAVRAAFAFKQPQSVLVQDGRAWNSEGFSIRFKTPHEKPYRKGKTYTVAMTYTASTPFTVGRPDPVKITAGANWIPLAPAGDIVEGSALDFSRIRGTEVPAGRYGRVIAKGASFEFEKRPGVAQRFYGVNVCGDANTPPSYEEAKRFAARLRKTGYNALRFHHHESTLVRGMNDPSATTLNPESVKRFDGLVAACVENGIYMTTDLFVSRRPIHWRAIGVDRDGTLEMADAKAWLQVHEGMQSNLFAFARNWLGHVNEFTGRRLADEPALAWISLVNEASQGSNLDYLSRQEPWVKAWKAWLAAKKLAEPEVYGEVAEDIPVGKAATAQARAVFLLFVQETESAFAAKVTKFLREEMKCRALLTNLNGCYFPVAFQYCKEADYDYVDDHFYVDHPSFLEKRWSLPSKCPNVNPLANDRLGVQGMTERRVLNRPFTCTEYNYSGPGRFRGVGGIATGALGALQGWSGLWRFAWSHDAKGVVTPEKKTLGYFDMSGDPLGLASERASICLFLRRDLGELAKTYAVHLPNDLVRTANTNFCARTGTSFTWAGWYAKLGTQLGTCAPTNAISAGTYPAVKQKTREEVFADLGLRMPEYGDFPRAGDGAIQVDRDTGSFTITTPRTCGGFAEEGQIRARSLVATLEGAAATVWASSLDGWPLDVSSHVLVTHLTDVQNTDITYLDEDLRVLLSWGHLPHLMRNGRARCQLRLADGAWKVYALAADGTRRGEVASVFAKGRLDFTAQVDLDPAAATYVYELTR